MIIMCMSSAPFSVTSEAKASAPTNSLCLLLCELRTWRIYMCFKYLFILVYISFRKDVVGFGILLAGIIFVIQQRELV